MNITEAQLAAAGFAKTVEGLPYVIANYEKRLPNGNVLTLNKPAADKARHLVTEFFKGQARAAVAVFIVENEQDLSDVAAGEGKKVLLRQS